MHQTNIRPVTYQRRKAQSKKSNFGKIFTILIVGIFLLMIFWIRATKDHHIPAKTYTITSSTTLTNLNDTQKLGINSLRYKWYIKLFAPTNAEKIDIGTYIVKEPTTLQKFLTENLKKATHTDLTITILPGWNLWDIDASLAEKSILAPGDFTKTARDNFEKYQKDFDFLIPAQSLEGFLFPDTYRITNNATADDIIRKLLQNFEQKIGDSYLILTEKDAYDTLILASIVEREERNKENRATIAGILSKRVKEKIPLGADATVCYGYQKTHKECTPNFIAEVINQQNQYNTRHTQGYPPTPISNFSTSAWEAALKSKESDYYYYLHDAQGHIHYGKTNTEHEANKKKYL